MRLSDQVFYSYPTEPSPPSFDLFIALYEDNTYNVNLCDKFAKYKMYQKLRATKSRKGASCCSVNCHPPPCQHMHVESETFNNIPTRKEPGDPAALT